MKRNCQLESISKRMHCPKYTPNKSQDTESSVELIQRYESHCQARRGCRAWVEAGTQTGGSMEANKADNRDTLEIVPKTTKSCETYKVPTLNMTATASFFFQCRFK
jgi:hypothetical protein